MTKNIIIVSDLHLTKDFDQEKYNYLEKLFKKADQLIIAGDFWSYYSCTLDQFLKSKWNGFFSLMLEKNCIHIYGNHDRKEWSHSGEKIYCSKACDYYDIEQEGIKIRIEHGHKIFGDSITNPTFLKVHRWLQVDRINYAIQDLLIKILGVEKYSSIGIKINEIYKEEAKRRNMEGTYLLTAHSHKAEISTKEHYLNPGFIRAGYASYILVNDKISLIKERY